MLGLDRPKKVNTKLFTIVRGDLPPGYQLAQTLHAGIELIYSISNFRYIKDWKEESNTVVCLSVSNEDKLKEAYLEATRLGFKPVCFIEPDLGDEFTSFAFISSSESGRILEKNLSESLGLALLEYWNK
jgi:peptidyl-tRNA hydrolase